MILNPLNTINCLRPVFFSHVKYTRSLRPTIKIGKDKFQLTLSVTQFNKDELQVKAHPDYVTIEGKQEKNTAQGYLLRQFVRKFRLPDGCIPKKIESKLSPEGVLTIIAPRTHDESNMPCEAVVVPISYGPPANKEKGKTENTTYSKDLEPSVRKKRACRARPKVKPRS